METSNIEKASLMLQNDLLKLENILLSAGIQPKELKKIECEFSSADAYNKASKQALIKFLESKKELVILMDEYIEMVQNLMK